MAQPALTQQQGGEPVYWGQLGLSIPYRWAAPNDSQSASQVVLYVSEGPAGAWKQVATATPSVSSFLYQSPSDGEYRFAVRTYDRYGTFRPSGPLRAELRVYVDTAPPTISRLEGKLENGVARVLLQADDARAIDPASLQLYVQTDAYSGWTPVRLTPLTASNPLSVQAMAEWRPPTGARTLDVRATVSDRAGNPAERTSNLKAGATPGFAALPGTPGGPAGPSLSPTAPPVVSKNPFDALGANPPPTWNPPETPVTRQASLPTAPHEGWSSASRASAAPTHEAGVGSQPWPADLGRTLPLAAGRSLDDPPGARAGAGSPSGPFSHASLSRDRPSLFPDTFDASPAARVDRSVDATRFEFDYSLEGVGRWGVATIELWGTDDDGATWRRYAIDNDRQSPIHVEAPDEGVYGFRLLVESVGGLPPERPRPGDRPEVTVRVDLTRPAVVLTRVEQGQGYLGDQLTIDWRVDERNPDERPIDLYYSNRPDGPWAPIATALENTGRYSWRLQRHVPERLYVRLEARDDAGNVGVAVTPEPVSLRLPKPSGALLGVRAAER